MRDDRWRPWDARKAESRQQEYDTLHDGVPGWLGPSLNEWLDEHFFRSPDPSMTGLLHRIELTLRLTLDWSRRTVSALSDLRIRCEKDSELFLALVNLALGELGPEKENRKATDELDYILKTGGSAWMVAPDRCCLVRRVGDEALLAARAIIESGSLSGNYLAEAWQRIYGRNPDPSGGYHEAVKAIEAVVFPVIIPNDTKATLGRAINQMKDASPAKYATVFEKDWPDLKPLDVVRDLLRLVYRGQRDRHGTTNKDEPIHVTQQQAEAVVHASITLVKWFSSGVVYRVDA